MKTNFTPGPHIATIRVICVLTDSGEAIHIGGPPLIARKTFDIPCPKELSDWLNGKSGTYESRWIEGVEARAALTALDGSPTNQHER